jgi:hypothetical protein
MLDVHLSKQPRRHGSLLFRAYLFTIQALTPGFKVEENHQVNSDNNVPEIPAEIPEVPNFQTVKKI